MTNHCSPDTVDRVAGAIMRAFMKKWFLGAAYNGPVYLDCVNGEDAWKEEARAALAALPDVAQSPPSREAAFNAVSEILCGKSICTDVGDWLCPSDIDCANEMIAEIVVKVTALASPVSSPQRGESDRASPAFGYALRLLEHFVAEHFPHNPDWKPCNDLMGVLTQLDNAMTIARDYKEKLRAYEGSPVSSTHQRLPTDWEQDKAETSPLPRVAPVSQGQ